MENQPLMCYDLSESHLKTDGDGGDVRSKNSKKKHIRRENVEGTVSNEVKEDLTERTDKRKRQRGRRHKNKNSSIHISDDNAVSVLNQVEISGNEIKNNKDETESAKKKIEDHNSDILNLQDLYFRLNGITINKCPFATHSQKFKNLDYDKPESSRVPLPPKKLSEKVCYDKYASKEEVFAGLQTGLMVEGTLRINAKSFQQGYVSHPDKTKSDILINGVKDRNKALEDDIVIVQFLNPDDTQKQLVGKVVFIKERRNPQTCVGSLKLDPKNKKEALFYPRDRRYPVMSIPFIDCPHSYQSDHRAYEKTLFLAKVVKWCNTKYTIGTLLSNIGQSDDLKAQAKSILVENGLDFKPFGNEFQHLYPKDDFIIPEEELEYREDFRKCCVFTIDPLTARDLDDAVSCRLLENGNFEIGVHISDVTYFFKEGTSLDVEVAKKATTVYLVDGTYHMLPKDLCFSCSLLPGSDKLTFSVIWEISNDGSILNHRFKRSIINSCCQLAYDHVQYMLDNPEEPLLDSDFPNIEEPWNLTDIKAIVTKLYELSVILRKKRYDGGALRIDQPKLCYKLDPTTGLPLSFKIEEHNESHSLIEEFMLLANCTVAERIYHDFPQLAFLRMHPSPKFTLGPVAENFRRLGIELDITSAGRLQDSLNQFNADNYEDKTKLTVLHSHLIKTLSRAVYFCLSGHEDDEIRHYSLNAPLYTHFTSPIRRYADIMVHRLLSSSLGYSPLPKWSPEYVETTAKRCNQQKYNAKRAGEMSVEVYLNKYIEINSPIQVTAAITEVFENSLDVVIFSMGVIKKIYYNNFSDDQATVSFVKCDDENVTNQVVVTWNADPEVTQTLQIFDIVQVKLKKTDNLMTIDSRIIRPTNE